MILLGVEGGYEVSVIYLDFAKAFDKVDHEVLLSKLLALGISGLLFDWICSFLLERRQIVLVDGRESEVEIPKSGVPQGSVLGPLLFLIHISDIDINLQYATASSFADDTRVMANENEASRALIQGELAGIYDWAACNRMEFNENKFEHIQYRVQHNRKYDWTYLAANNQPILKPQNVKDLGVTMDGEADFELHISKMVSSARRQAGWVLRTFRSRKRETMVTLYKSTVLPILEYCSQLWNPNKLKMIRQIESVQRYFTSRIIGLDNLTYWERLKLLDMYSLERRERYMILYLFKIILGITPNFEDSRFKIKTVLNDRRGRSCIIPSISSSASSRIKSLVDRSFPVRAPRLFNSLPKYLRTDYLNYEKFKVALDKMLERVADEPSLENMKPRAGSNSLIDQLEQMKRDQTFQFV